MVETVERLNIQDRERKLDVAGLVTSLLLSGGNHRFGTQSAVLQQYQGLGYLRVSRGAFYKWFSEGLATMMEEIGARACRWVDTRPKHLPDILAGRSDWRAFDATTIKLDKALVADFPGSGDYAAVKVHMELSLGAENVVAYELSAAREQDAPHMTIDERRRGQGVLADLAYASHEFIDRCDQFDVAYVLRVKRGWEFWFDGTTSDEARAAWLDDDELSERFTGDDVYKLATTTDIDVTVGGADSTRKARLVSFTSPKGRQVAFLTNLPRDTHDAAQVGLLYRLRWTIEIANKLCKSAMSMDEIYSKTSRSVRTLVHASMTSAILAQAIAHEAHLERGWSGTRRAAIKVPPVHPLAVAERVARGSGDLGLALVASLQGHESPLWGRYVHILCEGDPNWRRRPSAMDVVKGRTHKLLRTREYGKDPKRALEQLK